MRKMILTIITAAAVLVSAAELSFKANTGDNDLDLLISDLNIEVKADMDTFRAEFKREFKQNDDFLNNTLVKEKMEPAELLLLMDMSRISKKEPDAVLKIYSKEKKKGWGAVAKRLNIKPGSREFKALKAKTKFRKNNKKRTQELKAKDEEMKKVYKEKMKDNKPEERNEPGEFDKDKMKSSKKSEKAGKK